MTAASEIVQLWQTETGRERRFYVSTGGVNSVSFSADGRFLTMAKEANRAPVLRTSVPRKVLSFHHDAPVNASRFSSDSEFLVTACDDGMARVWSISRKAMLMEPLRHSLPVNDAAFDARGRRVLTVSDDRTCRLWFVTQMSQRNMRLGLRMPPEVLELSGDGVLLAVADHERNVHVYNAGDGHRWARRCLIKRRFAVWVSTTRGSCWHPATRRARFSFLKRGRVPQ